jgi:hypothetical protein
VGSSARTASTSLAAQAESKIHDALDSLAYRLMDSDEQITGLMAQTNASGYVADEIEVLELGAFDFAEARIPFRASIRFSGEQDEDRMFSGDVYPC